MDDVTTTPGDVRPSTGATASPTRRPATAFVASCMGAAALLVADEWWIDFYGPKQPAYAAAVLISFVLPILAASIPVTTLLWLVIAGTRRWHRNRLPFVSLLILALGGLLFPFGGWLSSLYGLDPPVALFLLGGALQLVAFATPVVVAGWTAYAIVTRSRPRSRVP